MTRAIAVLDLAERIEITPYAVITRADRHLSPTARLFHAKICSGSHRMSYHSLGQVSAP
jgi:hypothetical protein